MTTKKAEAIDDIERQVHAAVRLEMAAEADEPVKEARFFERLWNAVKSFFRGLWNDVRDVVRAVAVQVLTAVILRWAFGSEGEARA